MASRWSAPLYERPGRHGPRLLGFAWVDGGRDGSPQRSPRCACGRQRRPLHPGAGRSPAGGIILCPRMTCRPCPHARSAPPGAASRGGDRRQAAPLRRRAPAPCAGLDEVGKVLSHRRQALAVMAPHVGPVPVECVQQPDRVDLGHPLGDLVRREPADRGRFTGRPLAPAAWACIGRPGPRCLAWCSCRPR